MPGQPAGERKNMDKKDILSRVDHTLCYMLQTYQGILDQTHQDFYQLKDLYQKD